MNINEIYPLRILAMLLLCAAASCSQDEFGSGETLPPDKYPLMLTATVDGMESRTPGKDVWAKGDTIGVRIAGGEELGCYRLNNDGTIQEFVTALHWHTTGLAAVKAWFPYEPQKAISVGNQSEGFKAFDYLTAIAENQSFQNQVNLNFKHQMAKVTCVLKQDDGISNEEWKTLKLRFAGHTEASFTEGVLTGTKHDWITPKFDDEASDSEKPLYEALLVPQDMSGREFIRIDIKVNVNNSIIDKTFIFKPAEGNLQAGTHYKYNITVKKDRLEVQSLSASWTDDGKEHPAEPAVFQVNLPENVTLPDMIFSDNVEPHDKYLLVTGNRFTISYEVTDENMTKVFQIYTENVESDRDIVNRTITKIADDKFIYYFNYYLLSEKVDLKYVDFVQVGDYYYDNGTWGPLDLKGSKIPIGVVFKVGAGGSYPFEDNKNNYGWEENIHGYAVALDDATDEKIEWGASGTFGTLYNSNDKARYESPYTGYNLSMGLKESGKDYAAVKAAIEYVPNAPGGSSGWYLPSIKQLIDIQNLPDRASLFTDVDGKDVKSGTSNDKLYYWSCLERTKDKANCFLFDVDGISSIAKTSAAGYVRAVLTF